MIKRILLFVFVFALISTSLGDFASADEARKYELWVQSPTITSGITDDELRIYKALDKDSIQLYPLTQLGSNCYLLVCEAQMSNGGWAGNSKTSNLYYYIILTTDDSFVILSKTLASNEYWWDSGLNFRSISNEINASYYTSLGYDVPAYIINPSGKYVNSNMSEYDDYFIITSNGRIYKATEQVDSGCEGFPFLYNGILYRGQDRYYSSGRYYYYYMSDGTTAATRYQAYHFNNGNITYGSASSVEKSSITEANGYAVFKKGFSSNLSPMVYNKIPNTENLYFNINQPYTYNSTSGRSYYYQQINVYRCINGNMELYKTKTFSTSYTLPQTLTSHSLGNVDSSFYASKGFATPQIIINKNYVIMQDGTIGRMSLDSTIYAYWEFAGYNNRLVVIRNRNGSSYLRWADENGVNQYWQNINYIYFDSTGTMIMDNDISLKVVNGGNTGQNGYYYNYSTFNAPNFISSTPADTQSWWGRTKTNVFPDGRRITASWTSMGGNLYELWYNILNPDGTLCATGPTGYSGATANSLPLIAFAANNSKFVISINEVNRDWSREYYRIAVAEETAIGEVTAGGSIGIKNITPPNTTDTEPAQSEIDFAENDLPLGYNIRSNVIDIGKLNADLKQQVNSIRLNDIVIIKKAGYASGTQNSGIGLSYYSNYDYGLGNTYIRFYTNGQNFQWYCYDPDLLIEGTYNKTFYIDDKAIYVTVKIIAPPSSSGVTSITF